MVDVLRNANGEPLNTASEARRRVRLDEQVHVIALDAELDDAKSVPARRRQRAADGGEQMTVTERRQRG